MNVQAILQKIEDDAGKAAQQARTDAERKVTDMREASKKRLADMRDDAVKRAEAESEALAGRMSRMAELDTRKELLSAKRVVMDEAFERALDALRSAPKEKTRALMLGRIAEAARGDETLLVCADNREWFDASFMDELNAALKGAGKPAGVKQGDASPEGLTGAVLVRGGTEVYCTLEGMLAEARPSMETDIARELFDN